MWSPTAHFTSLLLHFTLSNSLFLFFHGEIIQYLLPDLLLPASWLHARPTHPLEICWPGVRVYPFASVGHNVVQSRALALVRFVEVMLIRVCHSVRKYNECLGIDQIINIKLHFRTG